MRGIANTQRPRSPGTGTLTAARGSPSRSARTSRCEPRLGRSVTAVGQRAGPDAGGDDRCAARGRVNAAPVQAVDGVDAVLAQAGHLGVGQHPRAVRGGRAGDGDDQPRVVLELAVPAQQRAAQPGRPQRGREPARLERAHAPRRRQRAAARARGGAQPVADPQAEHRSSRPCGGRSRRRAGSGTGAGRTRCGATVRISVARSTADSQARPDVAVLEVAQAAVDELRAPAARAVREVAALEQRDRQAAAGGVERDAGAGDAAADDHDVDDLAAGERARARRRGAPRSARRSWPQVPVDRARQLGPRVEPGSSSPCAASTKPRAISSIAGREHLRRDVGAHRAVGVGQRARAPAATAIFCMPPSRCVT